MIKLMGQIYTGAEILLIFVFGFAGFVVIISISYGLWWILKVTGVL